MKNEASSLLKGPVRPALLRYALPVILSMVATQFYSVADTMIIGLRLDANALAAVSNASTVLMIFLFISGGMELGGGLLAAAHDPTDTREEMAGTVWNLLFVDLLLAIAMMALGWVGMPWFLRLIHTPEEIMADAVSYGRIYLLGLPFLMPYDLSKEIVMGCGDSRTPLGAVLFTSLLNIVLDFALVDDFGVGGAAAATSFSQFVGAAFMFWVLHRSLLAKPFHLSMLRAGHTKEIFRLSAPNSVQQASGTVITLVKQGLLGSFGVAAIAGFSCSEKLSSLLMMPVYGFVQSVVFFIAQNLAAGQGERVSEGLREGRRILLAYSTLVAALCIFAGGALLRLFTADADAISYGATILRYTGASYLFTAQKHLLEARLRGARKMGLYLASNIGQIALNLLCCVLLVPRMGYAGFWLSTCISAPAGLALAFILVKRSKI